MEKRDDLEILSVKDVSELLGFSRQTLWRWQKAGKMPKRRKFGDKMTGWPRYEIREWIKARPKVLD